MRFDPEAYVYSLTRDYARAQQRQLEEIVARVVEAAGGTLDVSTAGDPPELTYALDVATGMVHMETHRA